MKILDTSSVIAFYNELNDPSLLLVWNTMGHEVCLPQQVFKEICVCNRTSVPVKADLKKGALKILGFVSQSAIDSLSKRYPYLGLGELSVIAAGLHLRGIASCYCVLDDKRARDVAARLAIPLVGTMGLLDKLVEKGHLDKHNRDQCLKQLKARGFRLADGVCDR